MFTIITQWKSETNEEGNTYVRWTQDGCGEGEDWPSYECVYTKLETELMSFLPVILYYMNSWSFEPRQCKEYSTFSGGGPGFGSFMRVFSLDKFTGSKSICCRLVQLF